MHMCTHVQGSWWWIQLVEGEVWAPLGWLWLYCSQVLLSQKPTLRKAPRKGRSLQNCAQQLNDCFPTDFQLSIGYCGGDSLNLAHSLKNRGWGLPRQVLKELCLWPTLLSLELLSKLLAGLDLWLYTKACTL